MPAAARAALPQTATEPAPAAAPLASAPSPRAPQLPAEGSGDGAAGAPPPPLSFLPGGQSEADAALASLRSARHDGDE
jgi:hypothetical protein